MICAMFQYAAKDVIHYKDIASVPVNVAAIWASTVIDANDAYRCPVVNTAPVACRLSAFVTKAGMVFSVLNVG